MKTVILVSLILGFLNIFFIYFMYVLISTFFSIGMYIIHKGKDKFIWYGQPLNRTYAKLIPYDSFKDMLKEGIKMTLYMAAVGFVIILIVCTCLEMKGAFI